MEKSEAPSLLSSIDSPADLRKLSPTQLPQVCADIRHFLIDNLSRHPGHFASSMGAVELTVALHYVFDTPYDRIVWDVGHQAYGHKLLTGRRDRFDTNRKLGGLSGFPTPAESEYDTFSAGHASNSISAALGMAVAAKLNKDQPPRNVIAVIGDASISGGLAFEGLNNAANSNSNLLIILNDNDMSIDRNVGSLNSYMAHLTTSKAYNKARYKAYHMLKHIGLVTEKGKGKILRFNNSLKALLGNQQNIFEGLNIRYFGPFDGHDVERIVGVLNDIKDIQGPRILHLRTLKGKGFEAAEKDPARWHAPGKFDPVTGLRLPDKKGMPKYQQVFGEALVELAERNPKIVGITAAMPSGTSMSLMLNRFPDRTFDVGIAEGHAVTFAGGLAKEGMKPFVAIYSSFLQRAYDHIIHDVALQKLPVVFCIDRAGLVGEDGATHHGAFDLPYLRTVPGMTIAAPRDQNELRRLMATAEQWQQGPFAIRYPRGRGMGEATVPLEPIAVGRGERLREGTQLAVLSIGTVAADVAGAIDRLEKEGISVAHYDMRYLKPLDEDILQQVADLECPIVTVEDGTVEGGLGSAVAEWLAARSLPRRVVPLGIPDAFEPQGTIPELKAICGYDEQGIYDTIKKNIQS